MKLKLMLLSLYYQKSAFADMYLQFPGGGNNRLNEPNRNRNNKNRLFDSQNNNRFGYNQQGYYFFTESEINMQWTVQHSCGPDSNVNCDIILQYACEDNLRDGHVTDTIPQYKTDCYNNDCNSDFSYGMHEDFQSYQHCTLRERNKGLYPADRNINGQDARYTRQENNGERYGYECNEERDHYPYWHPTIWKDIAVFTDDTSRCQYYQEESENVKGRWYCHVSDRFLNDNYDPNDRAFVIPINEQDCNELEGGEWKESEPHQYPNGEAMEAPVCEEAPYQRDNHHGNGNSRYFVGYKWTVPEHLVHSSCAVRIRYNVTSNDYDAWNIDYEAKELNERLAESPGNNIGQCFGVGEGPAKIGGVEFSELDIDMNSALEINPLPDERIVMTRDSANSTTWRLKTKNFGSNQWVGWRDVGFGRKRIKLSFDVKFSVKPMFGVNGLYFFNRVHNDWIDDAPEGDWYHVDIEEEMELSGRDYLVILKFGHVSVDLELRDFQLCVVDERADGNPFASMQDALGWGPYEAKQRGYEHKNDAALQIFERIDMKLRSAYNTDQLGRVFEDRSHKIKFKKMPEEIKQDMVENNKTFYNINVMGKIGNNVEVYPAFEYDFVPSRILADEGDYIHIQWSGSNTNDLENDHSQTEANGNTVQVLRGLDRHNMVAIDSMSDIRPSADPEKINSVIGLSAVDSMSLAFSGVIGGDNEYLQSAGPYFDLGIRKLTKEGRHYFMSSINNSHGTRTQKGKVIVGETE